MKSLICIGIWVFMLSLATLEVAMTAETQSTSLPLLLGRLNLDLPDLSTVKSAAADPDKAAQALLAYFRKRTAVRHPVDRATRTALRGKTATPADLEIANDALRNILIAAPVYPRHDFGAQIDWSTNRSPKKDAEWIVQLHRHYSWLPLGKAYWHTGDEKYAKAYTRQLDDWLQRCADPNGKNRTAWRSIEVGIRSHIWTHHFMYFLDSPAYSPELLVAQLNSFWQHANLLMSKYSSKSNWSLMEAEGLGFIAMTFPEFLDAEKWRKESIRRLTEEIKLQIRGDGHHIEQCINYHQGTILWFQRTADLAALNNLAKAFPEDYNAKLEKMYAVLMQLGFPDGSSAQFGDTFTPIDCRQTLAEGAERFRRQDFLYVATDGKQGTPPAATAFSLPDSGFYSMRSGWGKDAICLVLKCGPSGGFHCQPDNGTFELFAGQRRLTPDSGTFIYSGNDRKWFRNTAVHQTLTLDRADTAYAPRLVLWQPGGDRLDALVVENQGYKDLNHRRAVFFVDKRYFVVVDQALGGAAGNVFVHYQLAPGPTNIEKKTLSARTALPGSTNLLIQGGSQTGISLELEDGQVSFLYDKKEPRPAFSFRVAKAADQTAVRFVTVLVPFTGDPPKVVITPPTTAPDAAAFELAVTVDGRPASIGLDLQQKKAWIK